MFKVNSNLLTYLLTYASILNALYTTHLSLKTTLSKGIVNVPNVLSVKLFSKNQKNKEMQDVLLLSHILKESINFNYFINLFFIKN